MLIKHACLRINDIDYIDVNVYTNEAPRDYSEDKYPIVLDSYFYYKFTSKDSIKSYCDSSYTPTIGSEIHVVPDCPMATQDIRNSYKLKRAFDSGTCNVFSPIKKYSYARNYTDCMISNDGKTVVLYYKDWSMRNKYLTDSHIKDLCLESITGLSHLCAQTGIRFTVIGDTKSSLYLIKGSSSYIELLKHSNKKPCIYYEDLPMNRNQLNLDMVNMLIDLGTKWNTEDSIKNFTIFLTTLSQYNINDYKGTIALAKNIVEESPGYTAYYFVGKNYKRFSKPIIEFYTGFGKREFSSEKDFNMAITLANQRLNINGQVFSSMNDAERQMHSAGIDKYWLEALYDVTWRIREKKYEQN